MARLAEFELSTYKLLERVSLAKFQPSSCYKGLDWLNFNVQVVRKGQMDLILTFKLLECARLAEFQPPRC